MPGARCQEPGARCQEPGARSQEQLKQHAFFFAGVQKTGAGEVFFFSEFRRDGRRGFVNPRVGGAATRGAVFKLLGKSARFWLILNRLDLDDFLFGSI